MTLIGILDGIGIILMVCGVVVLLFHGLGSEIEWYWFFVSMFGFFLWGYQAYNSTNKYKIKLPIKYAGFELVPPESHAVGFFMWTVVLIGSVSSIVIEMRIDPFRYELLLPMIMSVVISTRITILFGERGFGVIKYAVWNYIKPTGQ